jgi:pimeloyl-ACP methyl ester carboxylesterase
MVSIPVLPDTGLDVSYVFQAAAEPQSDRIVVLHHGICHAAEHFLGLMDQLNARGIHAAVISQQSGARGRWRNCIGIGKYVAGMKAAVEQIERETGKLVGSYACHSMGALIAEETQRLYKDLRHPTVLMAPIPIPGALPVTLRIMGHQPLAYLRAVLTLDIHSLARTAAQVRELFFDINTPRSLVNATGKHLQHASFLMYIQLVLRRLMLSPVSNNNLPERKLLLYSKSDWIFHPYEYRRTRNIYRQLKLRKIAGGHDFFIENAARTADFIARFHLNLDDSDLKTQRPRKDDARGTLKRPHFLDPRDARIDEE